MKFSIIIATYNAEKYLERAINSILSNNYGLFEIIVIDGKSTDKTMEIVEKYKDIITHHVSEPDRGIYDAWNKGIKLATGDWIMFIGADDKLLSNTLVKYSEFISTLENPGETLYISSRIQMVDHLGKKIRIKGWSWSWPFFLKEMTVAHPGSLHSKKLFSLYGNYNIAYRSAGDYELLLRPREKLKYAFMDELTLEMQEGGISDGILGIKEHCRAAIDTGKYFSLYAYSNALYVYLKFSFKRIMRRLGFNVYLKRA